MQLISISTTDTLVQFIVAVLGIIFFFTAFVSLTILASSFEYGWKEYKRSLIVSLVSIIIIIASLITYNNIDKYVIYHYVINDPTEFEEVLETHEIYDEENGVYKLIKKK